MLHGDFRSLRCMAVSLNVFDEVTSEISHGDAEVYSSEMYSDKAAEAGPEREKSGSTPPGRVSLTGFADEFGREKLVAGLGDEEGAGARLFGQTGARDRILGTDKLKDLQGMESGKSYFGHAVT